MKPISHVKGLVICHGKSELSIANYITTNLHLRVDRYARDKGKHSIQITALDSLLKEIPFKSPSEFLKKYPVETNGKGKNIKLLNFRLFIIMDTDDCTPAQAQDFMSGKMFSGHWLAPYIVPIYSIQKMEHAMVEAGIMKKEIKESDKGSFYERIFPINPKPLSYDTFSEIKTFRQKIENCKKTNLKEFVDYCLSLVQG